MCCFFSLLLALSFYFSPSCLFVSFFISLSFRLSLSLPLSPLGAKLVKHSHYYSSITRTHANALFVPHCSSLCLVGAALPRPVKPRNVWPALHFKHRAHRGASRSVGLFRTLPASPKWLRGAAALATLSPNCISMPGDPWMQGTEMCTYYRSISHISCHPICHLLAMSDRGQ